MAAARSIQTVRVSSKHQIAIPADARRQLGIAAGDELIVDVRPGGPGQSGHLVLLRRPKTPEEWARGLAELSRDVWQGVDVERYVQEERDAWTDRLDSSKT